MISALAIKRDGSSVVMFKACVVACVVDRIADRIVSCEKSKKFLSDRLALLVSLHNGMGNFDHFCH